MPAVAARPDGSWLIDAMIEIERVEEALSGFKSDDSTGKDYQTLAGFVVKRLGHLPKKGETFEEQRYIFEILDMDRHRVDKVLVVPSKPQNATVEQKDDSARRATRSSAGGRTARPRDSDARA